MMAWRSEPAFCQSGKFSRQRGEAEGVHVPSGATRQLGPQAIGARGTSPLPFGFASKPSSSAPWARGLLSVFWEPGYPDLPACGP